MLFVDDIRIKRIKLFLFFLLFASYSYFYQGGGHNSNTRINLTRAIVEEGRFTTDSFFLNTADVAVYKGHTYCDKAPGTSFLGVPSFFVMTHLRKILPESFTSKWGDLLRNHFTIAFSVSLISAVAALFLFDILGFYSSSVGERLFMTLAYSLGTPIFAYSTLFYGHQVAGSFLTIILFLIHKIVLGEINYKEENLYLFIAGILAGCTVMTEYPTAPVIVFITIYLLVKLINKKRIFFFIVGGLIIAVLLFTYNYTCFDNPFSVGYSTYGSNENPSWSQMKKGVMGIQMPRPTIIYKLLFGTYRGLFYHSPFLLLSIPGFFLLFAVKNRRSFFYLSLIVVIYYLCLNSGYGDSPIFWGGGVAMGPRHLIPMLPFLIVPALLALRRIRYLGVFLILLSISFAFMAVAVEPRAPYDYMNPLAHYYIANFFRGELSKNIVTTFPPKFDNRDFVAYNIGEIFGLKGMKSLIPLISLWLFFIILIIRIIKPEIEKPPRLTYFKVSLMVLFFTSSSLFLHNLYGISDLAKAKGEQGLFGRYYDNKDWKGEPDFTRVDKRIDFIWNIDTGRPFAGAFSVQWEGYVLIAESGNYTFTTNSDDGSLLYIDDKLIVNNGGIHGSRMKSGSIYLKRGYHKIKLKFQDFGGGAVMELYWRKPGGVREIIETKNLVVSYKRK